MPFCVYGLNGYLDGLVPRKIVPRFARYVMATQYITDNGEGGRRAVYLASGGIFVER